VLLDFHTVNAMLSVRMPDRLATVVGNRSLRHYALIMNPILQRYSTMRCERGAAQPSPVRRRSCVFLSLCLRTVRSIRCYLTMINYTLFAQPMPAY